MMNHGEQIATLTSRVNGQVHSADTINDIPQTVCLRELILQMHLSDDIIQKINHADLILTG